MPADGIACYAALQPKTPYCWVWHAETVRQVFNDPDPLRFYRRVWELEHRGYATPCFATGQGERRRSPAGVAYNQAERGAARSGQAPLDGVG